MISFHTPLIRAPPVIVKGKINRNLEAMVGLVTDKILTSKSLPQNAISEIAMIKAGGDCPKSFSKERFERGNVPIFSNGIVNDGLYGYTSTTDKCVKKRSITVSARGTIGASFIRMERFIPIIRLIAITPNDLGGDVWIHQMISRMKFEKNGSVQQQLTVPEISNFIIPYPSKEIILEYEHATTPLLEAIYKNQKEIAELQRQRNELLPLLMNGQVSVMPTEVNCDLFVTGWRKNIIGLLIFLWKMKNLLFLQNEFQSIHYLLADTIKYFEINIIKRNGNWIYRGETRLAFRWSKGI